ncbi:MAG: methylglyoxal synthase [Actinomycetota bacterium]|nr:methylglyoxal synthase [Actinomycetota bacterium]
MEPDAVAHEAAGAPAPPPTRIALVAHDHKKRDLLDWCRTNRERLARCRLWATGTTGALIAGELGLEIARLRSGPLGGDLQIGGMIAEGRIDALLFFWDPLEPQPHDPDVRALLRIAVVWNLPVACNLATADLLFASTLLDTGYRRAVPPYPELRPLPSGLG